MKIIGLLITAILAGPSCLLSAQTEAVPPSAGRTAQASSIKPTADPSGENPCHTVIVYELGKADNFAPGPDPVSPSLALDALLQQGHPVR